MKTPNDLWGELGEVPEEEMIHVLTKLFTIYEEQLRNDSNNQESLHFFRNLNNALEQTSQCNLNRR